MIYDTRYREDFARQFRASYIRDDNTRWIPRDRYIDRVEFQQMCWEEGQRNLRHGTRNAIIITLAVSVVSALLLAWMGGML
jgi:hypothetical protein